MLSYNDDGTIRDFTEKMPVSEGKPYLSHDIEEDAYARFVTSAQEHFALPDGVREQLELDKDVHTSVYQHRLTERAMRHGPDRRPLDRKIFDDAYETSIEYLCMKLVQDVMRWKGKQ